MGGETAPFALEDRMAKSKKFPQEIYVTRENAGTSDEYLSVEEKTDELAVPGEKIIAGLYRLVGPIEVTAKPAIRKL